MKGRLTMIEKDVILTQDGMERLEQELEELRSVKRTEVADRIKEAIAFGDISENSEYDDAKNEQAFIEGRIMTLEKMLRNAKVIDDNVRVEGVVSIGSTIKVKDLEFDETLIYKLVGTVEADPMNNKISNESPVGSNIIGHKAGDIVEVTVPVGVLKYEILEVTNE